MLLERLEAAAVLRLYVVESGQRFGQFPELRHILENGRFEQAVLRQEAEDHPVVSPLIVVPRGVDLQGAPERPDPEHAELAERSFPFSAAQLHKAAAGAHPVLRDGRAQAQAEFRIPAEPYMVLVGQRELGETGAAIRPQ